jgi:hypothetical protein
MASFMVHSPPMCGLGLDPLQQLIAFDPDRHNKNPLRRGLTASGLLQRTGAMGPPRARTSIFERHHHCTTGSRTGQGGRCLRALRAPDPFAIPPSQSPALPQPARALLLNRGLERIGPSAPLAAPEGPSRAPEGACWHSLSVDSCNEGKYNGTTMIGEPREG